MEKTNKQYEISVSGRVQGVGFRYAARDLARSLGLKGWVENQADGSVLILVQGSPEACNQYIQWCHTGPGYSWVEAVDILEKAVSPLSPFRIRS
ncbi:MAG: acylphosphatase [Bacteroides sp.]|nr:acylphosphatase [Bacteroides sp.]